MKMILIRGPTDSYQAYSNLIATHGPYHVYPNITRVRAVTGEVSDFVWALFGFLPELGMNRHSYEHLVRGAMLLP
jgi:hypothetical protein